MKKSAKKKTPRKKTLTPRQKKAKKKQSMDVTHADIDDEEIDINPGRRSITKFEKYKSPVKDSDDEESNSS